MNPIITKYTYCFVAMLVASSIVSCKKLLNIPANPPDRISAESAFSDSGNVAGVMAGIYVNFGVVDKFGFITIHNGGLAAYTGLSADELINNDVASQVNEEPFYQNELFPTNASLFSLWADPYVHLYAINAAIIGIEKSAGLTPLQKQRFTGELMTVRAL